MQYRRLGRSGLKVSEISLGSWLTIGTSVGEGESKKIIHKAWDMGVNFYDTADVYTQGAAEVVLGKAIADLPRNELVVATKCMGRVWPGPMGQGLSRKHVMDAIDGSLMRLNLDYIDLYQAHAPDGDTPLEETLSTFNDLVRSGKVRYLGISNFTTEETVEVLRICERNGWESVVSHQPPYNLLDRRVEPNLIPRCRTEGIGLIVYSPLAQGILTGKYGSGKRPAGSRATTKWKKFMDKWMEEDDFKKIRVLQRVSKRKGKSMAQVALAWTLRDPVVSSAIIGATSLDQLKENLKAIKVRLTQKDLDELDKGFGQTGNPL
ncbi:MAG: aldo/keto reductase family protein [Candidatus Eisenbacteria bacterium]|uniref:Aldo/keto reductase family protein n=1 Tax=Eiseniibacteriota bacterium TaxID=2212470 RepID=A0A7Y2E8A2_UNCEI|nr:aldo/keto reductase family protein [Candidatus Eisenbacteria bacterium]